LFQIEEFVKDHTVILPTIRGYPPSDVPDNENAYEGEIMAGDLLSLIDHLHIEQAVLPEATLEKYWFRSLPSFTLIEFVASSPSTHRFLGTFLHLIHHDVDQQDVSKYLIKYISHEPGDDHDVGYVVRTIPDPVCRAKTKQYYWVRLRTRCLFLQKDLSGPTLQSTGR
jgi:epoxide hydrolase 4